MATLSAVSWCASSQPMSRHGTPTSAIGRLDLSGSSGSSTSGMPAQTRAMKQRSGTGQPSRHAASSGGTRSSEVTAGPSRVIGTRRTGHSSRPQGGRERSKGKAPEDDGDDDDSDDSNDDDDDDDEDDDAEAQARRFTQELGLVVLEVFCLYTDGLLTPHEFGQIEENVSGTATPNRE